MYDDSVTVIYHKNCPDGFGAAWAAHAKYPNAHFVAMSYNEPMPDLDDPKLLYIVDFSFKRDQMLKFHNQLGTENVILLDHHETALAELADIPNCIVSQENSGAIMTWDYLFPETEAPAILRYIEDRDLWRWELPHSREISAYIASWFNDRTFDRWNLLSHEIDHEFERVAIEGAAILRTHQQLIEQVCSYAHTVVIDGHEVPAAQSGILQSEIGEHLLEKYPKAPFAAIYVKENHRTRWSLRAREGGHNVAVTATNFQGGGHAAAAGFSIHTPRKPIVIKANVRT